MARVEGQSEEIGLFDFKKRREAEARAQAAMETPPPAPAPVEVIKDAYVAPTVVAKPQKKPRIHTSSKTPVTVVQEKEVPKVVFFTLPPAPSLPQETRLSQDFVLGSAAVIAPHTVRNPSSLIEGFKNFYAEAQEMTGKSGGLAALVQYSFFGAMPRWETRSVFSVTGAHYFERKFTQPFFIGRLGFTMGERELLPCKVDLLLGGRARSKGIYAGLSEIGAGEVGFIGDRIQNSILGRIKFKNHLSGEAIGSIKVNGASDVIASVGRATILEFHAEDLRQAISMVRADGNVDDAVNYLVRKYPYVASNNLQDIVRKNLKSPAGTATSFIAEGVAAMIVGEAVQQFFPDFSGKGSLVSAAAYTTAIAIHGGLGSTAMANVGVALAEGSIFWGAHFAIHEIVDTYTTEDFIGRRIGEDITALIVLKYAKSFIIPAAESTMAGAGTFIAAQPQLAAAALVMLAVGGAYYYYTRESSPQPQAATTMLPVIPQPVKVNTATVTSEQIERLLAYSKYAQDRDDVFHVPKKSPWQKLQDWKDSLIKTDEPKFNYSNIDYSTIKFEPVISAG